MDNPNMNMNPAGSRMWTGAAIAIFAAILIAGWMWWAKPAAAPVSETGLSATDTTLAIEQELQATDLGDLEAELQATDADLNAL